MEKALILGPLFFLVIGVFLYWLCAPLKRVYLSGDELLVDNFFKETRIPLSQIERVEGPDLSSLRRINLHLRSDSIFGSELVFAPPVFQAKETAASLRRLAATRDYRG